MTWTSGNRYETGLPEEWTLEGGVRLHFSGNPTFQPGYLGPESIFWLMRG